LVGSVNAATRRTWGSIANEVKALAREFGGRRGQAGDVGAGPGEAFHQAGAERIAGGRHHDRGRGCGLLGGLNGRRFRGDDDVDIETDQLGRQARQGRQSAVRRAIFDLKILPGDVAELAHPVVELGGKRLTAADQQDANSCRLCLLRARRQRPRHGRPSKRCNKVPPPHAFAPGLASPAVAPGHEP
jgi:hypothetical protein